MIKEKVRKTTLTDPNNAFFKLRKPKFKKKQLKPAGISYYI